MCSGWWRWLHTAPSLARGAGPRRGRGRSEPALSPRRPPPQREVETKPGVPRAEPCRLFHNVPAQDLAAGAACAISERSFVFFFFICLTGRRVVARRQGTFLSHVPGHGTRGCLFWGLLSSGSQRCFHKPVVSWVVEVVRWGRPAFAVMGDPWGTLSFFFCACVGSHGPFPDSSHPQPGAGGCAASCLVLETVHVAQLQPALLLSQQGASAGHFAMGVSVPSPGDGGLGTPELVRGGVGSPVACGAAQGSALLGQTWLLGAGRVFSPGEVLG